MKKSVIINAVVALTIVTLLASCGDPKSQEVAPVTTTGTEVIVEWDINGTFPVGTDGSVTDTPDMATGTADTSTGESPASEVILETSNNTTVSAEIMTGETSTGSTPSDAPAETSSDTVSYSTPGGEEKVTFALTTDAGVITAVTVTALAENNVSIRYQGNFSDALSTQIVGKKLSDLNLSAVGGASLTTKAFNEFIASV